MKSCATLQRYLVDTLNTIQVSLGIPVSESAKIKKKWITFYRVANRKNTTLHH